MSTPAPVPTGRRPPGKVGRFFARAPRHLYHLGLGGLLGRRFLLLEHTGRRSGLRRETVLEVIRRDDRSLDVAAAWGSKSDWFLNVEADPSVRISSAGLRRAEATASVADLETAASVFEGYVHAHPRAARALSRALNLPMDDPQAMAAAVPVVRFTIG